MQRLSETYDVAVGIDGLDLADGIDAIDGRRDDSAGRLEVGAQRLDAAHPDVCVDS